MYRFTLACGVLLAAACSDSAADSADTPKSASTCSPLRLDRYTGRDLPPKTLALTFDDGPGVRTRELSQYLRAEDVRAAFFVNGKMLLGGTSVLGQLVADGHIVGNHSQHHLDLTTLQDDEAIIREVSSTDAYLQRFVPDGKFLFRPPYGAWNEHVAAVLGKGTMNKYVGPILWDIGGEMGSESATDWDCWQASGTSYPAVMSVEACGDLYLGEIHKRDHGIVLMHDPYFIHDDPKQGGTFEMLKYILPTLKNEGYTFVRVDEIPAIASDLPAAANGADSTPTFGAAPAPAPAPSGEATTRSSGDSTDPCAPSPQGPDAKTSKNPR